MQFFICFFIFNAICQYQPWGVRLSFGEYYSNDENEEQLYVTFNTDYKSQLTNVTLQGRTFNCSWRQITILSKKSQTFVTYVYRCTISDLDWKDEDYLIRPYYISTQKSPNNSYALKLINKQMESSFSALAIGDWGELNQTFSQIYDDVFPCLSTVAQQREVAFILFLGDLGYELVDNNCQVYKSMLKRIQPITSFIPFMMTPGNHDIKNSYNLYMNSFFMPDYNETLNYFYSFDIGRVTFIAYNPDYEVYLTEYPVKQPFDLYEIVSSFFGQLSEAKLLNQKIVFSHYSIFCSDPNEKQCTPARNPASLRKYLQLFYWQDVDIYLSAHIHVYQRTLPVNIDKSLGTFQDVSSNASIDQYQYVEGMVHISEGAGGNNYFVYNYTYPVQNFTRRMLPGTGFGILMVNQTNKTLGYQHYIAKNCDIQDSFRIYKELYADDDDPIVTQPNKSTMVIIIVVLVIVLLAVAIAVYQYNKKRSQKESWSQNSVQLKQYYRNV